jgi:ribonuclease P protein component
VDKLRRRFRAGLLTLAGATAKARPAGAPVSLATATARDNRRPGPAVGQGAARVGAAAEEGWGRFRRVPVGGEAGAGGDGHNEYTGVTTPFGRGAPWRPRTRSVKVSRQESSHKANVSTQEGVPAQDSRVPGPDVDAGRPQCAQGAPPEGTEAPHTGRPALTNGGRLGGRGRFASVRTWRCVGRAGMVRVQAARNGRDDARLGLSVPGMASAVERNRVRRRLREAARGLHAHRGFDLIVSTDATALRVPFSMLSSQIEVAARAAVDRARVASGPAPSRSPREAAPDGGRGDGRAQSLSGPNAAVRPGGA